MRDQINMTKAYIAIYKYDETICTTMNYNI